MIIIKIFFEFHLLVFFPQVAGCFCKPELNDVVGIVWWLWHWTFFPKFLPSSCLLAWNLFFWIVTSPCYCVACNIVIPLWRLLKLLALVVVVVVVVFHVNILLALSYQFWWHSPIMFTQIRLKLFLEINLSINISYCVVAVVCSSLPVDGRTTTTISFWLDDFGAAGLYSHAWSHLYLFRRRLNVKKNKL